MPTEFPIAAKPFPVASTPAATAAETTTDASDLSAETQTFMSMLSQLLDDGAVVVAAPAQAQAIANEHDQLAGDVVAATPVDDSLLSLLLPSNPAANPAAGTPASGMEAARRTSNDALPLLAANAATLQRAAGKSGADAVKVTMEFQTTLSAQAADALLTGADKSAAEGDLDASLLGAHTTGRATTGASALSPLSNNTLRTQLPMESRVGTPAWADELAAKATFVHERGIHSASLRLSPEHLGPMEIQISVQDDKASVWFGAAHADTRAALEQALPRLRDMLGAQGLLLSDAGVFREPPRDQSRAYEAVRMGAGGVEVEEQQVIVSKKNVLLDAYA